MFEKLIYKRLYDYFNKFKILNFNQYGFRKNHSTAMAIYDILESKLANHDKDKVSCAIYLDLSKAFDTVDKTILLKKTRTLWDTRYRPPFTRKLSDKP